MNNETAAQPTLDQAQQDQLEEKKKISNTRVYLHCCGHAAVALERFNSKGLDSAAIADQLLQSIDKVTAGNTHEIESMLMAQAKSLEYMFYDALTKLPNSNMEYAEVFANIALRAQTGCRKTLMALADLKNPRRSTTFIKHQNNAIQVNNQAKPNPQEFSNSEKVANEVLRNPDHETLDLGGAPEASHINQKVEAMEPLHRSTDRQR